MLFTTYAGWHQGFAGLADSLPFRTKADYESYLTRLRSISEAERRGARRSPARRCGAASLCPARCSPITRRAIAGVIAEDPARSRFYEPFTRARPGDVAEAEWTAMQGAGAADRRRGAQPGLCQASRFLPHHYLPKCANAGQHLGAAGRARILRLPGAAGDDDRPDARSRSTRSASRNRRGSAPRWTRWRRPPASPAARPSSGSCAPIPNIMRRRPGS